MHLDPKRVLDVVVRDAIVVVIGVPLVLASVIFYAKKGPFSWLPSGRWWDVIFVTGALVWIVPSLYRRHWRQRSFWLNMTWLLALHVAGWSVVVTKFAESIGGGVFVMAAGVEIALFVLVLQKLGYDAAGGADGAA